ncbi:MAG: response regulator [Chloroflexota bacterium]|jgi:signal transduction histidine kinase
MVKILVIEDEASLLEEIVSLLQFEDFEIIGAPDGSVGVQLARAHLPDLIISDIMMPGLDGYGVLQALQDDPATRQLPFIFLTARADYGQVRQGMQLGADDYLTKPFTREELLSAIRARLEKREMVRDRYEQRIENLRDSIALALPHELRTPLTGLMGYAEMIMLDSAVLEPAQVSEMADALLKSGLRLQRQLQNFLLYAQLELGQREHGAGVLLAGALEAAPAQVIERAAREQVAERNREADLHVSLENVPVCVARSVLDKIVVELVDNAAKFSAAGTPIRVYGGAVGSEYVLRISDEGRGMSAEQIRDSGAYLQFERHLYEHQGVGLGLTLARQLALVSGGAFHIESEPGCGTTVTVRLPLASAVT